MRTLTFTQTHMYEIRHNVKQIKSYTWMCFYCCSLCYHSFMRYDEIQNSENWDAEKMGIEKFWVSDITFLSAPSPPTSISVSFLSVASPSDVLFEWPQRLCFLFMQEIKPEYKTNLQKLKNFVMVKFAQDTMVDPKESEVRYCLYCLSLFIWIIYAYSIKFTFFLILVVRLLQTRASCGMSNASREWNLYAGILFLYCFRRLNFLSWPSLLCRRNVLLSFL